MKSMMSKYSTDTTALKWRAELNDKGARYNLEDWIIQQVKPYRGMSILDLGCGTGKQIFRLASLVSKDGLVLGLDISPEAIREVNERAKKEQLSQIKTVMGSIDELGDLFQGYKFDLILSSYAIYYAKDMKGVLRDLRHILNQNGHLFICGPGKGTNQEMTDLINKVNPFQHLKAELLDDFIDELAIKEIGRSYSKFNTVRLSNQIQFDSVDSVMQWWKNHISYFPELHDIVQSAILNHFDHKDNISLTKNILGVHYFI